MRIGLIWREPSPLTPALSLKGEGAVCANIQAPESKNPAEAGFSEWLKLNDKPRSFEHSVVGSHSSFLLTLKQKPRRSGVF